MPENELIRAADSLPELSSGLRSSTMVLCQNQFARAQRIYRVRLATAGVLVASFLVAVVVFATSPSGVGTQPIADDSRDVPAEDNQLVSPGEHFVSPGASVGTSGGLAIGLPGDKVEMRNIDGKIDELQQRMLKAKMLPSLGF